ncbi:MULTISPECIES: ABC transporter ATP-binding protein [unclassified Chryseobacterium]|uniref:ABC transporter ATP-binding protein n=1 Tax=unclassified Chryseobacterium TaxID=2593645 RepID=UPI0009110C68|nr:MULTISPECIES: ABC transporter ATP-binding protein [unclassified Chryseobacterium]SHF10343.1 ABC-2 type transport system ATP-binding protein [Chryseobacterium sp. OV279]HCA09213.1 ABC transporter ATP-binding protein [Chryseobacterium sp.]
MIRIENTRKSYNGKEAVKGLSLSVAEGEIYGLLGPNGAGKSTTLNMLLGFLKPDSGTTLLNDIDTSTHAKEAREIIGYIPENVNLYPYLTGIENLYYFCKLAGKNYSTEELSGILTSCGLQRDSHNKKTGAYSKGMRQKVGIAIAYAKKAKVYLLDEPASGLDPLASNELSALLKKLADEGAAILMASHDIFRVRETCSRIGILKSGVLVKEMKTSGVTANELEEIYMDYMQR